MSPLTLRLVLLVSLAHGLVHIFELSLPSVEQMIGAEFGVGRGTTGLLGTAWRLPFGLGALLAGWLADRHGSKRMLLIYLGGCAAASLLVYASTSLNLLFLAMFAMGCFASIYHPAGLALISRETTPENRGAALGWHGILGSIGIAGAPFAAALVFGTGAVSWRQYYLLLILPAVVIGAMIFLLLTERHRPDTAAHGSHDAAVPTEDEARWKSFFLLVAVGTLMGFVYAAFMHFLPRYLDTVRLRPDGMAAESFRNYLAAIVLLCGVAGQALGGKLARPGRLARLLSVILLANALALVWVAAAESHARLWATCSLALVHFMTQPVYNSLIAEFVPSSRRSVGYGFSNMLCFGIGALGPAFAGFTSTDAATYGGLAAVAAAAAVLALFLHRPERSQPPVIATGG